MANFKRDSYVKITDTLGNYRFGYIAGVQERGWLLVIDLNDEGLSKINWDNEYAENSGVPVLIKDFNTLLSDIEKKMVPLLAGKMTDRAIAAMMGIASSTVRTHIRDMKIKFQLDTRELLFTYCQGIEKKLK